MTEANYRLRCAELEAQLQQLRDDNKNLLESRDKMSRALSVMGHDLRSPLQCISGFAYFMVDEESKEERGNLFKLVEEAAQQMGTLVNDIVSSTRLETGTMKFNIGTLSAASLLNNVYASNGPIFDPLPCELQIEQPDDDMEIAADRIRLKEVFGNFITNAAKYTDSGSVTLSMERYNGGCRFHVKDTGVGIAPENCERVFNKHEMLNTDRPGSGLGLYICRELAHGMNGEVGCSSELGKGSDFWVWMPLASSCAKG